MFDLFYAHFCNNGLQRSAITVSPDGGYSAYGWRSICEIWQGNGEGCREINICAEYIDWPFGGGAATMLHVMVCLYNLVNGIRDVSNNGDYHNKRYKTTAEAHGLHIEQHPAYGWANTTLTGKAAA